MKKDMKRLLFTFAIACVLIPLKAQETLTLKQCLHIGIENNLTVPNYCHRSMPWHQ